MLYLSEGKYTRPTVTSIENNILYTGKTARMWNRWNLRHQCHRYIDISVTFMQIDNNVLSIKQLHAF